MPLRAVSLLLLAGPLALGLVFGVLRDIPPESTCGDITPDAAVEAYRVGLWWIAGAAELVAVAVLVAALRAADGTLRSVRGAIVLVALAAGALTAARLVVPVSPAIPLAAGVAIGAAVAAVVWLALTRLSGVRLSAAALGMVALAALPAFVAGTLVAAILLVAALVLILPIPLLALASVVTLWSRDARIEDVPLAAAFHAAVTVPACAITVALQGSGPWIC